MKRIAVGQLSQESNGLNPVPTTRADFEAFGWATGVEVMVRYGAVGELEGFARLPEVLNEPVEWVGLIRAIAWSGGPLEDRLLRDLIEQIVQSLRETPVDGVLLSLHGAQCAQSEPDVSGCMLQHVREAVGPRTPVVATLDLHANLTPRMVHSADVLVGFHTFPHIDHAQCGERAARVLVQLLGTDQRPRVSAWKIPMLTNAHGHTTDHGVLAGLCGRIVKAEAMPEALSVGLFQAQPWIDVPNLGWAFYQAHFSETPPLDPASVIQECWEARTHAPRSFLRPDQVVPAAQEIPGRPVVVSESYDATNSGAPGDSTHLLSEFVRREIPDGGALTFCVDPESVARCIEAGQGASVALHVGGKRDRRYGTPLSLTARVVCLGEIAYCLHGHAGHNLPVHMGRTAVITSGDATIVLTEKTGPGSSPSLYQAIGLDPRDFKIVVAKSPEGFRSDYEPFAAGILYCAAPGCSTPHLTEIGYEHISRPLYPVDAIEDIKQAIWAGDMAERVERLAQEILVSL